MKAVITRARSYRTRHRLGRRPWTRSPPMCRSRSGTASITILETSSTGFAARAPNTPSWNNLHVLLWFEKKCTAFKRCDSKRCQLHLHYCRKKLSVKKATWTKSHRTQSTKSFLDSGSSFFLTLSFNALFCIGLKQNSKWENFNDKRDKIGKYKNIYTHVFDRDTFTSNLALQIGHWFLPATVSFCWPEMPFLARTIRRILERMHVGNARIISCTYQDIAY